MIAPEERLAEYLRVFDTPGACLTSRLEDETRAVLLAVEEHIDALPSRDRATQYVRMAIDIELVSRTRE